MKTFCPKCKTENERRDAVAGVIKCGECGEWFPMPKISIAPKPTLTPEELAAQSAIRTTAKAIDRHESIKSQAELITGISIFSAAIGVFALIMGLYSFVSNDGTISGRLVWLVMGSFFALALWLYLIAQIVHIRANTEK